MIQVKKLSKIKKNLYSVGILVEGKETSFEVSEDLVVEYRLLKDKELSKKMYDQFLIDLRLYPFYIKSLTYAHKYHKSTHEVRVYLEKQKLSENDCQQVIKKLKEHRFLDDLSLIQEQIDISLHEKHLGPIRVETELKNKGLPFDMVDQALGKIPQSQWDDNLAIQFQKLAEKRFLGSSNAFQKKIQSALLLKGFSLDSVRSLISSNQSFFDEISNDDESIQKDYQKVWKRLTSKYDDQFIINQKIMVSLLNKGYRYQSIKKLIEGGNHE